MAQQVQHVRQQARAAEAHQHERDRELLGGVSGAARWGGERNAGHADRDREHARILVAPGVLAQHSLPQQHQYQQTGGERRLHDHQRSQQQGHDLQREAEDRKAGAEQPPRPPDQAAGELQAQVRLVRRLPGVHGLERYP